MAGSNGNTGGALGAFVGKLENRIVLMVMAALLGIGGNQILVRAVPESVRPDKFTGKMAHTMEARIMHEVELRLRPHEEHLSRADAGWQLIYEMRQDIAVIKQWMALHGIESIKGHNDAL